MSDYIKINRAITIIDQMWDETVPGAKLLTREGSAPFMDGMLYTFGLAKRPVAHRTASGSFFHQANFRGDEWTEFFAKGTTVEALQQNGFDVKPTIPRRALELLRLVR